MLTTNIKYDCFLHLIFKIGTLKHHICTFSHCGKPLVQKSANVMPSGTILKTVQKSPIYFFVNKNISSLGVLLPIENLPCKSFSTPYYPYKGIYLTKYMTYLYDFRPAYVQIVHQI